MLGFIRALIPGTEANARPSAQRLFGFPSTPNYDGRQTATRTGGGLGGLFGFPVTPAYLDASLPDPEPEPEPCEPPTGDNDDTRKPSDPTR